MCVYSTASGGQSVVKVCLEHERREEDRQQREEERQQREEEYRRRQEEKHQEQLRAMLEQHWQQLQALMGYQPTRDSQLRMTTFQES